VRFLTTHMEASHPVSSVLYAEELIRRIHANEPDAFDELYSRYSPRVFGYLYQRLNGDIEEAEDLTAEVFAKVYQKIETFEVQGAPLSSWLFRIARNQLIDSVRRKRPTEVVTLDQAPTLASGSVFEGVEQHLAMDLIKGGLTRLTPEQRQVITMRFLEQKSIAETAAIMQRNEEAVKKLQSRGLAALRRSIECLSGCWRVNLDDAA
jgi:RNA polymerase sigma-70 factor, ECF subfamily